MTSESQEPGLLCTVTEFDSDIKMKMASDSSDADKTKTAQPGQTAQRRTKSYKVFYANLECKLKLLILQTLQ